MSTPANGVAYPYSPKGQKAHLETTAFKLRNKREPHRSGKVRAFGSNTVQMLQEKYEIGARPLQNSPTHGESMLIERKSIGARMPVAKRATKYLAITYQKISPQFSYSKNFNPRRILTKPSDAVENNGSDNKDFDLIIAVNDVLGDKPGHEYVVLDYFGAGTFGQVVKCRKQDQRDQNFYAVKIVKSKKVYGLQALQENEILDVLNASDEADRHHVVRKIDAFKFKGHLCIVFEPLSINLYELIKQNRFRGVSTSLVQRFVAQILKALQLLRRQGILHCDLKPENVLLVSLQHARIKVIDFGSACFQGKSIYTYIQSRFYRSPEVILGLPHTTQIDMWSLGCLAAELFLGIPLFPGATELNLLERITSFLGPIPVHMLNAGKRVSRFYSNTDVLSMNRMHSTTPTPIPVALPPPLPRMSNTIGGISSAPNNMTPGSDGYPYVMKNAEQFAKETNTPVPVIKKYFNYKANWNDEAIAKEKAKRLCLVHFLMGVLQIDPEKRWTPDQFTGEWDPLDSEFVDGAMSYREGNDSGSMSGSMTDGGSSGNKSKQSPMSLKSKQLTPISGQHDTVAGQSHELDLGSSSVSRSSTKSDKHADDMALIGDLPLKKHESGDMFRDSGAYRGRAHGGATREREPSDMRSEDDIRPTAPLCFDGQERTQPPPSTAQPFDKMSVESPDNTPRINPLAHAVANNFRNVFSTNREPKPEPETMRSFDRNRGLRDDNLAQFEGSYRTGVRTQGDYSPQRQQQQMDIRQQVDTRQLQFAARQQQQQQQTFDNRQQTFDNRQQTFDNRQQPFDFRPQVESRPQDLRRNQLEAQQAFMQQQHALMRQHAPQVNHNEQLITPTHLNTSRAGLGTGAAPPSPGTFGVAGFGFINQPNQTVNNQWTGNAMPYLNSSDRLRRANTLPLGDSSSTWYGGIPFTTDKKRNK